MMMNIPIKLQNTPINLQVRENSSDMIVLQEAEEDIYRFADRVHENDLWLDLGGNIGLASLAITSLGARVVVFEPDADSLALLKANIEQNGFASQVEYQPFAVTGTPGHYHLSAAEDGAFWHQKLNVVENEQTETPSLTFTEVINRYSPGNTLNAKIDIEGFEADVILETKLSDLAQLSQLVFEFHHDRLDETIFNQVCEHLAKAGFVVEYDPITEDHKNLAEPHIIYAYQSDQNDQAAQS